MAWRSLSFPYRSKNNTDHTTVEDHRRHPRAQHASRFTRTCFQGPFITMRYQYRTTSTSLQAKEDEQTTP